MPQKNYKYRWDFILLTANPAVKVDRLIQKKPYKVIGEVIGRNDDWKWSSPESHAEHHGYETEESAAKAMLAAMKVDMKSIEPF